MKGLLGAFAVALSIAVIIVAPGFGAPALLLCAVLSGLALALINRAGSDRSFLAQLFAAALLLRLTLATVTFVFQLQGFFGGDAYTYDELGYSLLLVWRGEMRYDTLLRSVAVQNFLGMPYYVASIYAVVGRNPLAVQFVNAVLGAATAVVVYLCAHQIFENRRVARATALMIAF